MAPINEQHNIYFKDVLDELIMIYFSCDCCCKGWGIENEFGLCQCWCSNCREEMSICQYKCYQKIK